MTQVLSPLPPPPLEFKWSFSLADMAVAYIMKCFKQLYNVFRFKTSPIYKFFKHEEIYESSDYQEKNLLKTENYQFEFYLQNDTFFMNFTIYIIYSKSIDVLILASNSVSYYASYF